jgi:hypothetical protein
MQTSDAVSGGPPHAHRYGGPSRCGPASLWFVVAQDSLHRRIQRRDHLSESAGIHCLFDCLFVTK